MRGVEPQLQSVWDMRAAANFIGGGTGTGLLLWAAMSASAHGTSLLGPVLLALFCVGVGLVCVWAEIGRPLRALNVLLHPKTSWMTREGLIAMPLFALGLTAAWLGSIALAWLTALTGLGFLYCQARIVSASKGIPAWREDSIVPLLVATGLAEGAGLFAILALFLANAPGALFALPLLLLIVARLLLWRRYRTRLERPNGAPRKALQEIGATHRPFVIVGHALPATLAVIALLVPAFAPTLLALAGAAVLATGWHFKAALITRFAYTQGFALERVPARTPGHSRPGVKPGWS